jgi:hypothetical protein
MNAKTTRKGRKQQIGKQGFGNSTLAAQYCLKKFYKKGLLSQSNIARMLGVSVPLVNDEAKKMGLTKDRE